MITKERLEELIKEEATIYEPDNIWQTVGKIHLEKKCYISEDNKLCNDEITYKDLPGATAMYSIPLEDLFETKEDARWELEMTATYADTLKLANYTNFENENGDRVFYHKGTTYELSLWWASDNTKIIRITWKSKDDFGWLFEKPLTKENYIEACKLCKKLFLGEEV